MTVDVICPYCNCAIDEAQDSVHACAVCGTQHHDDCWQDNNGCTVYGCTAAPPDEPKLTVQTTDFGPRPVQPTPMFLGQPVALGVNPNYSPPPPPTPASVAPPPRRPVPPPPPAAYAPPPPPYAPPQLLRQQATLPQRRNTHQHPRCRRPTHPHHLNTHHHHNMLRPHLRAATLPPCRNTPHK